jgi:hypothetical protein
MLASVILDSLPEDIVKMVREQAIKLIEECKTDGVLADFFQQEGEKAIESVMLEIIQNYL